MQRMVKEELHLKMLIYALTRVGASCSSYIFKIKTFNCLRQQKKQLYCVAAYKGTHSSGFGSSKHEIHCFIALDWTRMQQNIQMSSANFDDATFLCNRITFISGIIAYNRRFTIVIESIFMQCS